MLELYELPDEALANLVHWYAEHREGSEIGFFGGTPPRVAARLRLDGALTLIHAISGIPDEELVGHLETVYHVTGPRPAADTKYRIVWERDAIQALRKRVSPLEEVRNA